MSQTIMAAPAFNIPPMTPAEEDAVIHSRLMNDERIVRRIARRFNSLVSAASSSNTPDAAEREALLADIALLQCQIATRELTCRAEEQQVQEYEAERLRIEQDQERLQGEILQLNSKLQAEQVERKRKLEYDMIAEKVNLFPTRTELEESISTLEEEIAAIEAELARENEAMELRRRTFNDVVSQIQELRLMGKEPEEPEEVVVEDAAPAEHERSTSPVEHDERRAPRATTSTDAMAVDESSRPGTPSLTGALLNPNARPFKPKVLSTLGLDATGTRESSVVSASQEDGETGSDGDGDIEMGEVSEETTPAGKQTSRAHDAADEREEGEASPTSPLS
ncbi:hypothetical protein BKA62DRAFT_716437, partial [Auriculariales sp. MPI-PUGE-AT-0066]